MTKTLFKPTPSKIHKLVKIRTMAKQHKKAKLPFNTSRKSSRSQNWI